MFNQLICDAPKCDHLEPIEALTEDMIGKACPSCGANLLTREDFEAASKMEAAFNLLKSAGILTDEDSEDAVELRVNPHAGGLNMSIKPHKAQQAGDRQE